MKYGKGLNLEMKGIHGPSHNQLTLQFNPIDWSKNIHE